MLSYEHILNCHAYDGFFQNSKTQFLNSIKDILREKICHNLHYHRNYQIEEWKNIIYSLPKVSLCSPYVENGTVIFKSTHFNIQQNTEQHYIYQKLFLLNPWRKGPYCFLGVHIDSEWRSDWKWNRLYTHIQPLKFRRVLDIGCGNSYYLWQILHAGADVVVGIEPHLLNIAQFAVFQQYFHELPLTVLPMKLEEYPMNSRIYDTVFSMGVMYHRKNFVDHLLHCKSCLREGGEFVLETLIIEGDENTLLIPEERYAKMCNVWAIPSPLCVERLLKRCGFKHVHIVNIHVTTTEEQRSTRWMNFESLEDFLDPHDKSKTIEGYPAPVRAIFIAESP